MNINVGQLETASQILHLIHHRNRNQHRHTHWWKWLAMLKRSIDRLIVEIRHGESERASVRKMFMNGLLLPRCYVVFTQIINDNQFSALGLTLVAELARIQRIIGLENGEVKEPGNANVSNDTYSHKDLTAAYEDLGQAVAKPVTPTTAVEVEPHFPAAGDLPELYDSGSGSGTLQESKADFAVVDAANRLHEKSKEASAAKRKKIPTEPAKGQKRRPTNVIDHIFQGLE